MFWLGGCVLVLVVVALYALVLLSRWAVICASEEIRRHVMLARSGNDCLSLYSLEAVMAEAEIALEQGDVAA